MPYIKTKRRVFQYPDLPAAELALPRMRRADHTATIVPPSEEFEVLRRTQSTDVVLAPRPRK